MTVIAHPWDLDYKKPAPNKRYTVVTAVCPVIEARVAAKGTEFVRVSTPSGRFLYMGV